jgi:pimeloyl-ACP methyl ester carboxylesterase
MNISLRSQVLGRVFSLEKHVVLEDSKLEIIPFPFTQTGGAQEIEAFQGELLTASFCPVTDNRIQENKTFTYPIFTPDRNKRHDQAIILLHGLNERSWEKYLPWAEYLAASTGKPVILFPIAFHMNRTPGFWTNPREIQPWVHQRKENSKDSTNSTFVNLALSSRLSGHPLRFYASGRESVYNICQLVQEMKQGQHPLFAEDVSVNLFAYSIGALLSQVLLLANPGELFTHSRLFMFCGGSIFNHMNGNARDILDKEAYDSILQYFTTDFLARKNIPETFPADALEKAFKAMICPEEMPAFRENFFQRACDRVRTISLRQDVVMPTQGIIKALGKSSGKILKELDFPSHQKPFPVQSRTEPTLINNAFRSVFHPAAEFL